KVKVNAPFAGPAKIKLLGLPPKVTAPDVEITADAKELNIPVTVDATGPPGQHRGLFCQVNIVKEGEPIVHTAGGTELRIDVPIVAKAEPAKPAAAAATTPAAQKPPEKRLTRLEQLRKEQEEREKAAKEKKDQ